MKTSILLDTNILLSAVLPNNLWKNVIEEFFKELRSLLEEKENLEVKTTGLIRKEISNIIEEITVFLNEEFRTIIGNLSEHEHSIDREKLKELQKRFNEAIIAQQEEKTRDRNRNLLMVIEHYLLQVVKDDPKSSLDEHLLKTLTFINNFEVQLKNSVEQALLTYKITKLVFPQNEQGRNRIMELKEKLPMKNNSDKVILSFFLYHLEQSNMDGWLITHDFGDFHAYAPILQREYQQLTILRPSYLYCFYHS